MESVDITIVGAGIVGLSVAAEVATGDRSVFLLEKNHSWGQETSSRNSEVIHAGIYYQPGSLKAVLCVEGRKRLYEICEKNDIGCKKIGKIIVASSPEEVALLHELQEKSLKNGVPLDLLDQKQLQQMEPEVACLAGLYSQETGIVDTHSLMEHFLKKARSQGAELVCEAQVTGIQKKGSQYVVGVDNQGEKIEILSTVVINCAGNNADQVAALPGLDIKKKGYEQYYLKGNYFRLSDQFRNKTNHLVYPVPNPNSLGIHTVLDLNGGIRLGPDEEEVPQIDYQVNEERKKDFYASVKKFLPCIEEDSLCADMAGIRPQLKRSDRGGFRDFIISHEDKEDLSGIINLVGIESPGITAAPAIAKRVGEIVNRFCK